MTAFDPIADLSARLTAVERSAMTYRQGVVASSSPLTVKLGNSPTAVAAVALDSAGALAVDTVVAVATFGNDLVVLGPVGYGSSTVTSLPGSPYPGQEVSYLADATNGVVWQLKYNAASASAYKWEVLGGGELNAVNTTAGTTTTGTTAAFGNTPTVTVPLAGDYYVGATGDWSTADSTKQGNIQIGNGTILTAVSRHGWTANNTNASFANSGLLAALAASDQVKLYGFTSGGAATLTATTKQLTVRPIRVG